MNVGLENARCCQVRLNDFYLPDYRYPTRMVIFLLVSRYRKLL